MAAKQAKGTGLRLSPLAGRGRSASALRVRGSLRERSGDCLKNTLHIVQHVVVPEAENTIFVCDEPSVTRSIASTVGVLAAIHFDDQTALTADQINRIRSDRLLPDEFVSVQSSTAKTIPERPFRLRRSFSQFSGAFGFKLIARAHVDSPPHPSRYARRPLPASGERQ